MLFLCQRKITFVLCIQSNCFQLWKIICLLRSKTQQSKRRTRKQTAQYDGFLVACLCCNAWGIIPNHIRVGKHLGPTRGSISGPAANNSNNNAAKSLCCPNTSNMRTRVGGLFDSKAYGCKMELDACGLPVLVAESFAKLAKFSTCAL